MNLFLHKRVTFVLFLLMLFFSGIAPAFSIQEVKTQENDEIYLFNKKSIEQNDVLSLQDCVSIAFYNSPEVKKYKYRLDVAKSNVGMAKSEYFPVIGAGVGFYNENNSNRTDYGPHTRDFPQVSLTVNKLVWNFGKTTAYIKMEEFFKIGAEYEFLDSLCRTLFDVKAKYYAVLKTESNIKAVETQIALCEKFLDYTKELSKTDELYDDDFTNAQLNLNDAKLRYLEAQNDHKNAIVDLNNAMFVDSNTSYSIRHTRTFDYNDEYIRHVPVDTFVPAILPFDENNVVEIAYKNSPDLRVLDATKNAMEQSLLYIKRSYFPDLYAGAGYGYNNVNHLKSNNSLSVGVNLESSVNLMNLKHSIKGADAILKDADNEISFYKKNLYFVVKKAMNNLEKYEKQIPLSRQKVDNAYKHLVTATNRYKNQKSDYTALQDSIDWYTSSMVEYIDILYMYNIALIDVEEATHSHIIDIHHKTEHAVHHHENELIDFISKWMNCDEKEVK